MPWDEAYLQQHVRSFGSRPIRVLTTGKHGVHFLTSAGETSEQVKYEEAVGRAQARWLQLSSNARQVFVQQSSEYIEFDQPDAVVDAIRNVFDESK